MKDMKKVANIEDLLAAIGTLRKLGTIGVQIIPNQGAVLLPRDDFVPSNKMNNVFFNEQEDLSEESLSKNEAFLGGKFSVFSNLGEVRRIDRAYLVPLKVCNHFRELYQEVEIGGVTTTDSTEVEFTFTWGMWYKPIKEIIKISFSELKNIEPQINIKDKEVQLSECPVECMMSFDIIKNVTFDCRLGHFEYYNQGGACYSLGYELVGNYAGEVKIEEMDRGTRRPFILTLNRDGASVQETIEYKTHTEERSYGPSLSNDERRYDAGGVREIKIIDKLVWSEARRLTLEEAEEFYSAKTWDHRKLREIYAPKFLAWELGSEETIAKYKATIKKIASERLAARIEKSKKALINHPFAVRIVGESYIERCETLFAKEVIQQMTTISQTN